MPATELLFRNPAFGRFFAARAFSFIGDGVATVALILLVQGRHGTGVAVGALLLARGGAGKDPAVLSWAASRSAAWASC